MQYVARLLVVGLFLSYGALAQRSEIGGGLGGMLYKGDVSPGLNPRFFQPAGNLFYRHHFSRSFAARAGIAIGRIGATDRHSADPFQQARNYGFRTNESELTLDIQYKFRNFQAVRQARNWTPYVFGGIGLFNFRTNTGFSGRTQLMHPLGVGVQYAVKGPWSVGIEFGTRFTYTDDLDGLGQPATTAKLQQGNPALRDKYTYMGLTLSYTFYRVDCPQPGR